MKSSVMGLRSMVQLLEDNIKEKGILNILFMKHTLSFPCALYFISPTSHGRDFQEHKTAPFPIVHHLFAVSMTSTQKENAPLRHDTLEVENALKTATHAPHASYRPCYTMQFFLQLASQFSCKRCEICEYSFAAFIRSNLMV
jgi:hypothetical protein